MIYKKSEDITMLKQIKKYISGILVFCMILSVLIGAINPAVMLAATEGSYKAATLSNAQKQTSSNTSTPSDPAGRKDLIIYGESSLQATSSNAALPVLQKSDFIDISDWIGDVEINVQQDGSYVPLEDDITLSVDAGFNIKFNYNLSDSDIIVYAGDILAIDLSSCYQLDFMYLSEDTMPINDSSGNEIGEYYIEGEYLYLTFNEDFIDGEGNDSIYGSFTIYGHFDLSGFFDGENENETVIEIGGNRYTVAIIKRDEAEDGNSIAGTKRVEDVYYYYHGELTNDPELFPYSVLRQIDYSMVLDADSDNAGDITGLVITDTLTNIRYESTKPLSFATQDVNSFYAIDEAGNDVPIDVQDIGDGSVNIHILRAIEPGELITIYYSVLVPEDMYYPVDDDIPGGRVETLYYRFKNDFTMESDNKNDEFHNWSPNHDFYDAGNNQKKWIEKGLSYHEEDRTIDYKVSVNFGQANDLTGWHLFDHMDSNQEIASDVTIDLYPDSRKEELIDTIVLPKEDLDEDGRDIEYEFEGHYYAEISYTAKLKDPEDLDIYNTATLVPPDFLDHGTDYGIEAKVAMDHQGYTVDKKQTGYDIEKNEIYWHAVIDSISDSNNQCPIGSTIEEIVDNEHDKHSLKSVTITDGTGRVLQEDVDYRLEKADTDWMFEITGDNIYFPLNLDITTNILDDDGYGSYYENRIVYECNGHETEDRDRFGYGKYMLVQKEEQGFDDEGVRLQWYISAQNFDLMRNNGIKEVLIVDEDPEGLKLDEIIIMDEQWDSVDIEKEGIKVSYEDQVLKIVIPNNGKGYNIETKYTIEDSSKVHFNNKAVVYVKDRLYPDEWKIFSEVEAANDISGDIIEKYFDYSEETAPFAEYSLNINAGNQDFSGSDIMITDKLGNGLSLVADSILIMDSNWDLIPKEKYELTLNGDSGFTVTLHDCTENCHIEYKAYVNGIPNGENTVLLDNSVQFIKDGELIASDKTEEETQVFESSATAGSSPAVNILKTNEAGSPLQGVVFGIYECSLIDDTWTVENMIDTAETDDDGKIRFRDLDLNAVYLIKEEKPLPGYEGGYENYFAVVDANSDIEDFNETVELVQNGRTFTVVNSLPHAPETEITIRKEWEDGNNFSNTRPESIRVELYQNGSLYDTILLKEDSGWQKTINVPDGYQYSIKEANVPDGYASSVQGYVITNTLQTYIKLPETGGIGALPFLITGTIFVAGAGLWESKKRK